MRLFDDHDRSRTTYMQECESPYGFLDESNRPEAKQCRERLERWFAKYPPEHRSELAARLRGKDQEHAYSALLELMLHEVLVQMDCVTEIHPDVRGSTKHPEFLVTESDGNKFYLEAKTVVLPTMDDNEGHKRFNKFEKELNHKLRSSGLSISISLKNGYPKFQPSAEHAAKFIRERPSSSDYDTLTVGSQHLHEKLSSPDYTSKPGGLPVDPSDVPRPVTLEYSEGEWRIGIVACRRSKEARGKVELRPVAATFTGVYTSNEPDALYKALASKAGRYGSLRLPYMIALNTIHESSDATSALRSLFGASWVQEDDGCRLCATPGCAGGLWGTQCHPKNRSVSAVIIAGRLGRDQFPSGKATLYLNPWAEYPYRGCLCQMQRWNHSDGKLRFFRGLQLESILSGDQ